MGMGTLRRHWDRPGTTACCKAECTNDRGVTADGLPSVHCQFHTDEWQLRLAKIEAAHPNGRLPDPAEDGPVRRTVPVFTPPAASFREETLCVQCGIAPRDWPHQKCEDCRHG